MIGKYEGVTAKVLAEIHQEDVKIINELREELSIYKELVYNYQKILNLNNIDKISKELGELKGKLLLNNKKQIQRLEEAQDIANNFQVHCEPCVDIEEEVEE